MNDFDEKLQYLDLLHKYLYLKKVNAFKDFDAELTSLLDKIILIGRNTFLLLFINKIFIKDGSSFIRIENKDFQLFQNIISYLIPENTNFKSLGRQEITSYQIIRCQDIIRNSLSNVKIFSIGIHRFFLSNRQTPLNSEYFGTVVYPSLFGYFSFSEMIEGAYQLLMMTMIIATYERDKNIKKSDPNSNGSLNDAEGIMFSSFFNGFPHFINSFCTKFLHLINKYVNSFHEGSIFMFICESLEFSSQYLTPYHVKVIKYVMKNRKVDFFMHFFVIRVLQDNLSLYLESDYEMKCKCLKTKSEIMNMFKLYTTKLKREAWKMICTSYIQKIVSQKSFAFSFQSIEKKLNRYKFSLYMSGHGERIMYGVLNSSECFKSADVEKFLFNEDSFKPFLIDFSTSYFKSAANRRLEEEIERNLRGTRSKLNSKKSRGRKSEVGARSKNSFFDEELMGDDGKDEEEEEDTLDICMRKFLDEKDREFILNDIQSASLLGKGNSRKKSGGSDDEDFNNKEYKCQNINNNSTNDNNISNNDHNNNNNNESNDNINTNNNNNESNNNKYDNNNNNESNDDNNDDINTNNNNNESNNNKYDNNNNNESNNNNNESNDNNNNNNFNNNDNINTATINNADSNNSSDDLNDTNKNIDTISINNSSYSLVLGREFSLQKHGRRMRFLCETDDTHFNHQNIHKFASMFIDSYEDKGQMLEDYISIRLNKDQLNLLSFTFKQREDVFLSFLSTVITNSFTFSNDNGSPSRYIETFPYKFNNSKSALMNPYFELMGYKEVHFSAKFEALLHEKQLLQKFKLFFIKEAKKANHFIQEFDFKGVRKELINDLVLILTNIHKIPLNDQMLVLSKVKQITDQIVRSLKFQIRNAEEKIFLYAYMKSESDAVLPTFLVYWRIIKKKREFAAIMDEFDPNIKKAIDMIQNAIINLLLAERNDLQLLIVDFFSSK